MDALTALIPAILILAVMMGIALAAKKLRAVQREAPSYPYEKEPTLFTPAERSFMGALEQACVGQYRIMGKVRLADIIKVKSGLSAGARQNAFNRIQSKHIDFVMCDTDTLSIQCVIELDDKSHQKNTRQQRDTFVDNALKTAGVPIFRFPAKHGYSMEEIRSVLFEKPATSE